MTRLEHNKTSSSSSFLFLVANLILLLLLGVPQHYCDADAVPYSSSSPGFIQVDVSNLNSVLEGEWMVEFDDLRDPSYASLESVWEDFFESWRSKNDIEIKIGQVDVSSSLGLRFIDCLMIDAKALPTILHVKDGVFRQYEGPRSKEGFLDFLQEERWKDLEPIASNRRKESPPSAFRMAWLEKIDDMLRNGVKGLNIPAWAKSLILVLIGIVTGRIFGDAFGWVLQRVGLEAALLILGLIFASALASWDS